MGHSLTFTKLPFSAYRCLNIPEPNIWNNCWKFLEFAFFISRTNSAETTTLSYIINIISNTYLCYITAYTFNSPTTFGVFLFNTKFLDNIITWRRSSLSGCLIAFHTSVTQKAWSQRGPVKACSNWSRAASTVCLRVLQLQTYARQQKIIPYLWYILA